MTSSPELSIVIPTLNEEKNLAELLAVLAMQADVGIEVIVADGGSSDGTLAAANSSDLPVRCLPGVPGRAFQLNGGAAAARGGYLLFLHADSRFHDPMALRRSLNFLRQEESGRSGQPVAGRFVLRFRRERVARSAGYRYLELKAKLNRKGCSHGDQGIMLARGLFREIGGFDDSCQILAETRFADKLRGRGEWLLLPAEISTSARRFELEGLKERQLLNAVIMALGAAGRDEIINGAGVYPPHNSSGKLQLQPLFKKIHREIELLEGKERREFWEKIGGYVCENAWQLAFRLDTVFAGSSVIDGHCPFLETYDRYLHRLTGNRMTTRFAAWASRLWFRAVSRR